MPKLIPNSYKPKLPKFLSYPVGFEKLSAELDNATEPDVRIVFASPGGRLVRAIRSRSVHPIMMASFTNRDAGASTSRSLDDMGFYGPKIELWVYPVARERRAEAVQLLLSEGFNRLRQWLAPDRTPVWKLSRHSLTVAFAPEESLLEYSEDKPW
jgi:hypothetical protein